ncbi:MAG: MATE family efflux transporter [Ferrovibrio sp.]|uniref:MATE family efflux transporter n=1 Tax=Ferrovibrio sp. TaxID=1917215 RepID=UPI00391AAD07
MSTADVGFASTAIPATASGWTLRLEEGRSLLRLALPIALIALVNMGMSVTDTLMVSWLFGAEALAAVAVGSDLYSIIFYFCAGTLGGLAPFYTAAVTRADSVSRAKLERTGWIMVALLALLSLPAVWFAPAWLEYLGLGRGLLDEGTGYTRSMALTLIPMLGVTLYRTVLTAAEKPKVFLNVTMVMLPLNAVANYVLMMGAGPIPAFGPTGAGLSTLLVAAATLAALLFVARRATATAAMPAAAPAGAAVEHHGLGAVLRVGLPIGVTMLTETGIFLAVTLYAAALSAADVAAHTLTLRLSGILYAGSAAMLQAAMVRMARAATLEDAAIARAVVTSSLLISLTAGAALFALMAVSAEPLAVWFFDSSAAGIAAAKVAVGLLLLLGLLELIVYPGLAALGLLRGRKDTAATMTFKLVSYWVIGAPLGIWLCEIQNLGVTGLWIGLVTGAALTTLLTMWRLFTRH